MSKEEVTESVKEADSWWLYNVNGVQSTPGIRRSDATHSFLSEATATRG